MAGIHRRRPGAADIAPAREEPAVRIGRDLWMSPGVSNSYAIGTDDGRVVVNAGLPFEGHIRRRSFDAVCEGPTRALVITQGHADHFAGYRGVADDGTDIVMQQNWHLWKAEHELLPAYRVRNTSFAFAHLRDAMVAGMSSLPPEEWNVSFPTPTVEFPERLELTIGGREIVLLSTPGGETTDSQVVWVPDERTVFTGNLFGPLFGHVPNLVTIRGDRYREALQYVASADIVLALGAERLVTGHFDPVEGADEIAEEVTTLRDATQWVHDRTIEGMEAGADVLELIRDITVPPGWDLGEGYGRTAWNVRAIWETHAGWFHHRSTTELYGVPASSVSGDLVTLAGASAIVDAARARIDAGEHVEAIHLIRVVLDVEPQHVAARAIGIEAHEALLGRSTNFWESAWLHHVADELRGDFMTTVDELFDRAQVRTGLTEIDSDSWREGLGVIVELTGDPRMSEGGRAMVETRCVDALSNRLRVHAYVQEHPEVLDEQIVKPMFILGMPRTGTTVASYLLAQDPDRRSLLKWEAVDTVPPATTDTLRTDPRCLAMLEKDRSILEMVEAMGVTIPHWEDADGPTECMFLHEQDFKGLLWDSFTPGTAYADWLLSDCDVTSTYEYQKLVLQVLQSTAPGTWSLKMPSHGVHLAALLRVFPDAQLVWAHRDPLTATGSLCNLLMLPAMMTLEESAIDKAALGQNCTRQMREHVMRPLEIRRKIGDDRFHDLHYADLLRDPIGQMRSLYDWAGQPLGEDVERAMRSWLEDNPQHKLGKTRYTLDEYGLSAAELEPVFEEYLESFDIEAEGFT